MAWPTRTDKLKNCILFRGASFTQDRETLYSLYVQYVNTDGIGSNIINKYIRSKNGRQCYLYFESHFRNESYLTNKASAATASMNSAVYRGDHLMRETIGNYGVAWPTRTDKLKNCILFEVHLLLKTERLYILSMCNM